MEEKWKVIPNYSKYECSTHGRIKTFNWKGTGKEAIMKPAHDKSGYLRTMLKGDDGNYHTIKVHRIVAQTFLEQSQDKVEVNHKNGIKDDNRVENLEWVTRSENIAHSLANGLQVPFKGEEVGTSKLTEKEVLEIREKFVPRKYSRVKLAKEYNVTEATIKDILYKRTWKHLL